ncbi:hypothetical protein, partial [Massilia varians]|uniref:hypothetical protein n=1 Tax=Massilia varians TaxID=457921 RepID=UPI00361626DC
MLNEEYSLDGNGNGWIIGNIWSQPNTPIGGAGWAGQLKADGVIFSVNNTEILANYSILKDSGGTGTLNFGNYMARFGFSGCDLLTIDLGINDSRGVLQTEATQAQKIADAKAIITSYLAYN